MSSKVKDYIQFSKALKKSVGDNFQLKFLGEQIKIQFYKIQDFTFSLFVCNLVIRGILPAILRA